MGDRLAPADPEEFTAGIWAEANSKNPIMSQTESRPDINRPLMAIHDFGVNSHLVIPAVQPVSV